ncbi:MAG: hypothetical protein HY360_22915 [Verrucomicrobia bacterium]|nr:hypothetical protein [Verrucomicrobiota bacterium]
MKVAYVGPEGTFSHELAAQKYPDADHVPTLPLPEVVRLVAAGKCDLALVPLFNNNAASIEDVHSAIAQHQESVSITGVEVCEIRHCLFGFGTVAEMTTLMSKDVVFSQVSHWIGEHAPSALKQNFGSTAEAVQKLSQSRLKSHGAIGSRMAQKFYDVPILIEDIQNKPNRTLFASLSSKRPLPYQFEHLLMYAVEARPEQIQRFLLTIAQKGFRMSFAATVVSRSSFRSPIELFDIDADPTFRYLPGAMIELVSTVQINLKNFHFLGGYSGMTIAHHFRQLQTQQVGP